MPGRNVSPGCFEALPQAHKVVPFGDRTTRLPVLRRTAMKLEPVDVPTVPVSGGDRREPSSRALRWRAYVLRTIQ
jgi:hypothetical protein